MAVVNNTPFINILESLSMLRNGEDNIVKARRAICNECSEHYFKKNVLRCKICGCSDPTTKRPRCPVGKWGKSLAELK